MSKQEDKYHRHPNQPTILPRHESAYKGSGLNPPSNANIKRYQVSAECSSQKKLQKRQLSGVTDATTD